MARVLVINESLTVRMDLKELLESAGHSATLCADLPTARRLLDDASPELIVLDATLSDGDGRQLLADLRASPATAAVPVILLAEESLGPHSVESHLQPGALLSKPYDPSELLGDMTRLLAAKPAGPAVSGTTILAVDDSRTYLHALEEQLREDGHHVLTARSGETALQVLVNHGVDCILMDLTMPGLSGQETCRRIKANPAWRGIPVLMLTGREDREAMIGSFNAGADDFISKSSETEVLKARLHVHLRRRQSEQDTQHMRERLHQKELEAAEARGNRELAEMRAVLLADLERKNAELHRSQDELRRAKDLAEAANRAKDEFLAVLSHELRTPLTPVLATASLLERKALAPEILEDIRTIRRNVQLEARIIDDLLDLTRVARGKMQFDMKPTNLHLLVRSAVDICCHGDGAPIRLELAAPSHIVHGDAARLQQVFWNLLTNARKFTPAEGRITIRSYNPQPDRIVLEVSDTGAGIEAKLLPRIFTAFEQGDIGPGRSLGGLGLGLAISKAIVDAHHGRISAHSAGPDQGATFTIDLATVSAAAESQPRAKEPGPAQPANRALRVLLVEDREASLKALCRLIEALGHQVSTAKDVQSAVQIATREQFDLLISDLGLPDGTGHELMQRLQTEYGLKGIAISGYGMEEDIRRSKSAGFFEHLVKPVDLGQLEAAISRAAEAVLPTAGR